MNTSLVPITLAYGDGIGPEIMQATIAILEKAKARITTETIEIGEQVYRRGLSSGIEPKSWESLRRTKIFLKAPITTPQGGGYKSLNVTVRKTLGLFANVRPCVAYYPYVQTKHPNMDVVIVRENEEDLYAGIEYRQTDNVYQSIKLISRPGSEKIIRYAFEYARVNGRKKVTCFMKDNIMKLTDGIFHKVFKEIGEEYPDIKKDSMIIDIGTARLADTPEWFDVIVTLNLYGDIISDVASQIAGSVGLGGSSNIGENIAMFEAVHGSAPDIAGKNMANPSGLLMSAVMMLLHIGQPDVAETIQNAWLKTLEDGIHTGDLYSPEVSREKVGTKEFADAVIARLGQKPGKLKAASYTQGSGTPKTFDMRKICTVKQQPPAKKEVAGVDFFMHWRGNKPDELATLMQACESDTLKLDNITNRGVKVWPAGAPETFCSDHWRCRFITKSGAPMAIAAGQQAIAKMFTTIAEKGLDAIKSENLYNFDGQPGYSLGQGE